jgi:hypothetical protein
VLFSADVEAPADFASTFANVEATVVVDAPPPPTGSDSLTAFDAAVSSVCPLSSGKALSLIEDDISGSLDVVESELALFREELSEESLEGPRITEVVA